MHYINLHEQGHCHSVEVWDQHELVGGVYGLAIKKAFFGESMFSLKIKYLKNCLGISCFKLSTEDFHS